MSRSMNHDKVEYLMKLLGKNIPDEFEDINLPPISSQLDKMLLKSPIVGDDYQSESTELQSETETLIKSIYNKQLKANHNALFEIENHEEYIMACLTKPLPHYFSSLDSNHSWMLYWLINSFQLLHPNESKDSSDPLLFGSDLQSLSVAKITTLILDNGKRGIGGGANQAGHVASTYAAVLTLILLKQYDLLDSIRLNLKQWFLSLKQPNGSFIMHEFGESDTRSTYCVLVCCSLLNLLTDDITENTLTWLNKCQTYEGGFAGVADTEAHGGYTFCALSSYFLVLGKECKTAQEFKQLIKSNNYFNFDKLLTWLVYRQLSLEGGFNGRSNKLVDSCYGFWIGACHYLLESVINKPTFDKRALKIYLLNCGQQPLGGFKDKPNKSVDFYHTNYSLLGLSISEYLTDLTSQHNTRSRPDHFGYYFASKEVDEDTDVCSINPIFGVPIGVAESCNEYFMNL